MIFRILYCFRGENRALERVAGSSLEADQLVAQLRAIGWNAWSERIIPASVGRLLAIALVLLAGCAADISHGELMPFVDVSSPVSTVSAPDEQPIAAAVAPMGSTDNGMAGTGSAGTDGYTAQTPPEPKSVGTSPTIPVNPAGGAGTGIPSGSAGSGTDSGLAGHSAAAGGSMGGNSGTAGSSSVSAKSTSCLGHDDNTFVTCASLDDGTFPGFSMGWIDGSCAGLKYNKPPPPECVVGATCTIYRANGTNEKGICQ